MRSKKINSRLMADQGHGLSNRLRCLCTKPAIWGWIMKFEKAILGLRVTLLGVALILVGFYLPLLRGLDADLGFREDFSALIVPLFLAFLLLLIGKFLCLPLAVDRKALIVSLGLDLPTAAMLSSMQPQAILLIPIGVGFYLGYLYVLARFTGSPKIVRSVKSTTYCGVAALILAMVVMLSIHFPTHGLLVRGIVFLILALLVGLLVGLMVSLLQLLAWLKAQVGKEALEAGPTAAA